MNRLTVVCTIRDRNLSNVEAMLSSLDRQTIDDFTVLCVDYGSHEAYTSSLRLLTQRHRSVRVIRTETQGLLWNKAAALNIGLAEVTTPQVLITDADLYFPETMLSKLLNASSDKDIPFLTVFLLGKDFQPTEKLPNMSGLKKETPPGVHCVRTEILRAVGGYDEYYRLWGVEDVDLYSRYLARGYKPFFSDDLNCYHLWHEKATSYYSDFLPETTFLRKIVHGFDNSVDFDVSRFTDSRKLERSDRPLLALVDSDDSLRLKDSVDPRRIFRPLNDPADRLDAFRMIEYFMVSEKDILVYCASPVPTVRGLSLFLFRIVRKLVRISLGDKYTVIVSRDYTAISLFELVLSGTGSVVDYIIDFERESGLVHFFVLKNKKVKGLVM